jgi:hypothetical protein
VDYTKTFLVIKRADAITPAASFLLYVLRKQEIYQLVVFDKRGEGLIVINQKNIILSDSKMIDFIETDFAVRFLFAFYIGFNVNAIVAENVDCIIGMLIGSFDVFIKHE